MCFAPVESIYNAGMDESFGTLQPAGMPGEKRERCRASVKELEARGQLESLFSFVNSGSRKGEGITWNSMHESVAHGVSLWLVCAPVTVVS